MDVRRAERDAVEAADRVLLRDGPVGGSRERRVRGDEFEAVAVVVAEGDDRLVEPLGRGVHAPRIGRSYRYAADPSGIANAVDRGWGLPSRPASARWNGKTSAAFPAFPRRRRSRGGT